MDVKSLQTQNLETKKIPSEATECIRETLRVFYHRQESLRNEIIFPRDGKDFERRFVFLSRKGVLRELKKNFFQGTGGLREFKDFSSREREVFEKKKIFR